MFGTSDGLVDGKTSSSLTTIYATSAFETGPAKYGSTNMFGSKLTLLAGGNGTTIGTNTDTSNKLKAKYAKIETATNGVVGYLTLKPTP